MKKSDELKLQRSEKLTAQEAIVNKAKTENRALTAEEQTQFETLGTEFETLSRSINSMEAFEKRQAEAAAAGASVAGNGGDAGEGQERQNLEKRFSVGRALRMLLSGKELDGAEKEVHDTMVSQFRSAGLQAGQNGNRKSIIVPMGMMLRALGQTVTEDSGNYGGKLVQNEAPVLLDPFLPMLTLEQMGATVYRDLSGDLPLVDSGAFTFESLAETAETTPQKVQYADRVLKAKRIAAEAHISNQLLSQSAVSVEVDIRRKLGYAANRKLFIDAINGAGSATVSLGLLNDTITDLAPAASAISHDKLVDLENAVLSQNSTTLALGFLSHPSLKAAAKKVKVDAGSGIFIVGGDNNGIGYGWETHSDMPILATNTQYPLIFGDWSNLAIGFWGGGFEIVVDPYTKAGANSVRLIVNMHKDSLAANPKAFATIKTNTIA